jgi:CheY-like chemotaxis protein
MVQNILIVDDDDEDIELFCEAVNEINPNIICNSVGNGKDALKMLLREGAKLPDYIFLDMNMPKMGGKQCLKEIKKNIILKDIAVVMYSTSKLPADLRESLELGAANFWTKPSSFITLKKDLVLLLS